MSAHAANTDERAQRDELPTTDELAINTLRFLAADMVERANSGHPGMPMGAAPMAWTLWSRHLRHDPADPAWADRDRFVLSAGHGCALLYGLLHLSGYDLPLSELQQFRQLGSRTPGHPEHGHTVGVETTTGPLGQGLATAVGMALAERLEHARSPQVTDHFTYVIVGDGCLMEGISHEAASFAGHLQLGRLIVLFDDNEITIDGSTAASTSDDHLSRFAAYGWHVNRVADGTDIEAIDDAIIAAKADARPSFIAIRTVIGAGAPGVEGTSAAHGSPLGPDVLAAAKRDAGWPDTDFHVPDHVRAFGAALARRGAQAHAEWSDRFADWAKRAPDDAAEWHRRQDRELPDHLDAEFQQLPAPADKATRQASQTVLKALASTVPELIGGSADLAGSTGTGRGDRVVAPGEFAGSTINFGIREFAMAAIANGLSLHGGWRPFVSTFLVFSDYLRPALRLSALMGQPVVYILTHDSVAVGEDGPTHQPVEHVESLRLIPGVQVLRPADEFETREAWRAALLRTDGPTALILSRQSLPALTVQETDARSLRTTGARVVVPADEPAVDLLSSGSEVALAIAAAQQLATRGTTARVISVLDRARFERSSRDDGAPVCVAAEAGATSGWRALTPYVLGVDGFGASGPGPHVAEHLGLTADALADLAYQAISATTPLERT